MNAEPEPTGRRGRGLRRVHAGGDPGPPGIQEHCGNKISFRADLWFFGRIPLITIDRWLATRGPYTGYIFMSANMC